VVLPTGAEARVLTLASLVDVIAHAWAGEGLAGMGQARMCCLADDARWLLGRIVELRDPARHFDEGTCATLLQTDFWEPFCAMHPDARALLREAGVPVARRDEMLAMALGFEEGGMMRWMRGEGAAPVAVPAWAPQKRGGRPVRVWACSGLSGACRSGCVGVPSLLLMPGHRHLGGTAPSRTCRALLSTTRGLSGTREPAQAQH
jgi:hypothetical protein